MSGADVFTMEPDEVHKSVEILFNVESQIDTQTERLANDTHPLITHLVDSSTAYGPALAEAVEWWRHERAGGFKQRCGDTGEYLAVCTAEAVEVDDYTAGDFETYADTDRYPGRSGI
ncbi:hypothetical protein [Glycomyces buryatensis]|uniref:WXG100 family type VII secretion target n=1 Tax=Glycomyces buryatensis TaxID=2570927 RepID=A0A4V4HSU4_9ACTN|nr:hypothetical protein [Glycomyces buryatensis]THV42416.1 hypothetical protein FAB82_07115 [Glycomyces buryatensis]